jgi:2-iminobutanoate/2-iminopropanoate deaminase
MDLSRIGDPNLPYAKAVRAGGFIFLSGAVGVDSSGEAPAGVAAQTTLALQRLADVCNEAACKIDRAVKATVYLTNAADFADMNVAYRSVFSDARPARSTVVVAALSRPDLVVEIDLVIAD